MNSTTLSDYKFCSTMCVPDNWNLLSLNQKISIRGQWKYVSKIWMYEKEAFTGDYGMIITSRIELVSGIYMVYIDEDCCVTYREKSLQKAISRMEDREFVGQQVFIKEIK